MSWHTNIERETLSNTYYRKVVYTDKHQQVVLMCLNPGEGIPAESHAHGSQFFRVEAGQGVARFTKKTIRLHDGVSLVVPPRTRHEIINTGDTPLKMYTIYSPPQHREGTVQRRAD